MLKKVLVVLYLLVCCLIGAALAEETEPLPQMVKVDFPAGAAAPVPRNAKENYAAAESGYSEDGLYYHDDSLDVRLHKLRRYDTDITVAFVQMADPAQLKTELAKPYPSKATIRILELSRRVKAVFSVNGDWFTYHNTGIVYRNGELLRNRSNADYDGLAIDINGDFHIVRPMTEEEYAKLTVPIAQSFVFGPALVINGEVQEIVNRKITYQQRVGIGQIAPLSYVFVATNGPFQDGSAGLTVPQLAELMHGLGAQNAYMLDGGGSTSMMFHQVKVVGEPKTMRAVGDILYVTTAIPDGK